MSAPGPKACKFCQAPVFFAQGEGTPVMTLDAQPVTYGKWALYQRHGKIRARMAVDDLGRNEHQCPSNAAHAPVQTDLVGRDLNAETEQAMRKTMGPEAYEMQRKLTGGGS